MRLNPLLPLMFVAALALFGGMPGTAHAGSGPLHLAPSAAQEDPTGARVIVKYKTLGTLMRALRATPGRHGGPQMAAQLAQRDRLRLSDGHVINDRTQVVFGDKTMSSAALAAKLASDPDVEYAVPDLRRHRLALPNDPLYASWPASVPTLPAGDIALAVGQWYLRPPDSTFISAIDAQDAWVVTTGSASVVVADVDTGALYNHPDLAGKLLPGRNFVSTNGNVGSGWSANATDPGDWTTANECGSGDAAEPSSWHGTQTASLIGAATNNGAGMASVGYNVMVQPVRVLAACGGYDSDIIAGMYWAGGLADPATGDPSVPANSTPAKVINMSLGGSGSCTTAYQDAIAALNAAGVTVVIAAGNDEGLPVSAPGNCPGAIAVAGLRNVGTKVGFSSIGPEVAIAAPAGNCINTTGACLYPILTATNTGATTASSTGYTYSDSTNYSVGTSFATPMVSGTVALMLSINPSLTPAQIRTMLQSSARTFPTTSAGATSTVPVCTVPTSTSAAQDECICSAGPDPSTWTCGAGMLDAGAAVAAAAGVATSPVAVIVASQTSASVGVPIALSGASSSRSVASYQWSITAGQGLASLSSMSGSATTVTLTGAGNATVALTVTDGGGRSSTSSISLTAVSTPTATINASTTTASAGSSVSFDGRASTAATGLSITGYQWAITAGQGLAQFTSSTNAATATVKTAATANGSFTVSLTVTDSLGQQSSSSQAITVLAAVPVARITTGATAVTAGSNVTVDGSTSTAPAGRTIAGYQWSITSGSGIASITGSQTGSTATIATSAAGSFTVTLTVTDSTGAQASVSQPITVSAAATAGGGGGGGAMSPLWVLGVAAATVALWLTRRRQPVLRADADRA